MANRIPEELVEEVRLRSDIVEIISEHVTLQRKGKVYLGLCPFHGEKTPSFTVSHEKQMFYCFGCHTGGNVFSFLMKKENWTFLETVQNLAHKHGILLPEKELSQSEKEGQRQRRRWAEIHEWASNYFQKALLQSDEGGQARSYFQHRGINEEIIKKFRLGYSPNRWDGLLRYMSELGVQPEELVDAGLALEREGSAGHFYDRFRNRAMFSIINIRGEVIGFGGRVLDDGLPKYLNSPETAFFNKGHHLYGMYSAYQEIRQKGYAVLVEGYMDVIAVQSAGIGNAVASLGTALTREQAKLLRRYTQRVVMAYDADSAGVQATLRAAEIFRDIGITVNVVILNEGKDPDEFIKAQGATAFRIALDHAKTFVEFKYLTLIKEGLPQSIREKAELVASLAPDILKVDSPVEREGYERFLSFELSLTLDAVQREIASQDKNFKKSEQKKEYYSNKQDISVKNRDNTIRYVDQSASAVPLGIYKAERLLLRILMEFPSLIDRVQNELKNFWHMPEHEAIFQVLKGKGLEGMEHLPVPVQSEYASLIMEEMDLSTPESLLHDCMRTIRSLKNEESIEEMQARMANLEKSGDQASAMALLKEIGERLKRG